MLNEKSVHFFSVCCLKHWSGMGAERAKTAVSGSGAVSRCEKNWLERGTERGAGVTEIGLSN